MHRDVARESIGELPNPLGLEGLEFVEYATHQPQALGQLLEQMGFRPVARHRSREVLLYRQGGLNLVVNAHDAPADEPPAISAFALRVRDAAAAHRRVLERGAWPVPVEVPPMELHVPAIHGAGASRIYFVDRWRDFSIWDVDFVPIPGADAAPPALTGLHAFGLVQYIGVDRMRDWCAWYEELLGWQPVPDTERYGILPRGTLLRSPCGLMLQLIEPDADTATFERDEYLQRLGLGTPDVLASVAALHARGVEFVESPGLHTGQRGALTQARLGSVMFELVQHRS